MSKTEVDRLKEKWADADEQEIDDAIKALIKHRHGRRLLWWLLSIGRWGGQPYSNNALSTAFACGELNVGQQLAARILEVEPDGFVNMMKESNNERNDRDRELADASDRDASYGDPADG